MSVHEKMTAIADAIRAQTGGTGLLTLDQMAAAISGLESGGGISIEGTTQTELTIGANTIANAADMISYFAEAVAGTVAIIVLKTAPDTSNQIVFYARNSGSEGVITRYRGGALGNCGTTSAYDAVLVEGTTYLVIEWG